MILPPKIPLFLLIFCVLFSLTSNIHASASQGINQTTNNNPHIGNVSPIISPTFNPQFITNTTSTIDAIGVKISDVAVIFMQTFKKIVNKENIDLVKNNMHLAKEAIKNLIWQNRYKIAGGVVIGSYSAMSLLLIADYHSLKNNMFWIRWKARSTFEDLCAVSQKELARELLLAIGQHHYNKTNPTDLAYPLITFIKEIDWEIDTIKRYIKTTKILKAMSLMLVFPTNDKKLNRATKMLERALFIKHIFLSWLADYNLTSTEKLNA